MASIIFRVWKGNAKVVDINVCEIHAPKPVSLDEIVDKYNETKLNYPDAEVMLMIESKIWHCVESKGEMMEEDILFGLRALDKKVREGIL